MLYRLSYARVGGGARTRNLRIEGTPACAAVRCMTVVKSRDNRRTSGGCRQGLTGLLVQSRRGPLHPLAWSGREELTSNPRLSGAGSLHATSSSLRRD